MCQDLGDWPPDCPVGAAQRSPNTAKEGYNEQGDGLTDLIETGSKFSWVFLNLGLKDFT